MFANAMNEMMNDILRDPEMDKLLDSLNETTGGIFNQIVTSNDQPPSASLLYGDLETPVEADLNCLAEQQVYTQNIKELTGNEDDDILRKTAFMDKKFTDMLEYMMEDTIFNLIEEATYEEFDLTQAPKIYIRKEQTKI